MEVGDGELAGGNVWEQVEDPLERRLVVVGVARREQEDLRVDPLERGSQRLFVVDVDDDLEAELDRPPVQLLEVVLVVVLFDHDQAGVRARLVRGLGRGVDAEEDRKRRRVAQSCRGREHRDPFGALLLGETRPVRSVDEREDRDSVSLRDRLAEASPAGHCAGCY